MVSLNLLGIRKVGFWRIHIDSLPGHFGLALLYYLLKLDHLLCVPAMYFLYRGLRRLLAEAEAESAGESPP